MVDDATLLGSAMMIDFSDDGPPVARFCTDTQAKGSQRFEVPGGSVEAEQAGMDEALSLGTGALLWQSSPALAQALARGTGRFGSERIAGMRALELGAGCAALPSVVAAVLGARVVATDLQVLVPSLRANLERYVQTAVGEGISAAIAQNLAVQSLDWTSEAQLAELAGSGGYDLVLCADCIDESEALLGALVDVICASLAPSGVALIASGARSQRLLAIFLAGLERHFHVETLSDALGSLSTAEAAVAAQRDETRFFAATWIADEAAASGRAAHAAQSRLQRERSEVE